MNLDMYGLCVRLDPQILEQVLTLGGLQPLLIDPPCHIEESGRACARDPGKKAKTSLQLLCLGPHIN